MTDNKREGVSESPIEFVNTRGEQSCWALQG